MSHRGPGGDAARAWKFGRLTRRYPEPGYAGRCRARTRGSCRLMFAARARVAWEAWAAAVRRRRFPLAGLTP